MGSVAKPPRRLGEEHPRSVMSREMVELARAMHDDGWSFRNLGRLLGVSDSAIRDCVRGRTWRHVRRTGVLPPAGDPIAQMASWLR